MTKGLLFWIVFILALFGWGMGRPWSVGGWGWAWSPALIILIFILGWHNFGFVVR